MEREDIIVFDVEDSYDKDLQRILTNINEYSGTEHKFKFIKDLRQALQSNLRDHEKVLRKLIFIYLKAKVRHPVKSTIQALFNQLNDEEFIVEIFKDELCGEVERMAGSFIECRFHLVSCINELSQNFCIAIRAVGGSAQYILQFLNDMIDMYIRLIQNTSFPTEKNEFYHQLHCCIQSSVFCIKSHINEHKSVNEEVDIQFAKITEICMKLLDSEDTSVDTKNLCAMLIVMRNNTLKINNHIALIESESESSVKRLCLISGVIQTTDGTNIELMRVLCDILHKLCLKNSSDPATIHAVIKSFNQIVRKLNKNSETQSPTCFNSIIETSMNAAFSHLEYFMDTIRHLSREILRNLLTLGNEDIVDKFFDKFVSLSSISLQASVLNSIHMTLSLNAILSRLPSFQRLILSALNETNKEFIANCYEALSHKSYDECGFEYWNESFIQPIIDDLKSCNKSDLRYSILINLLQKCFQKDYKVILNTLDNRQEFDVKFILLCLKMAKNVGLLDDRKTSDEMWKGVLTFNEIKNYITNADDEVRILSFELLIETKKTLETFSAGEIQCVMYFLTRNMNCQDPCARQKIINMMKKFCQRIQSAVQVCRKNEDENGVKYNFEVLTSLQTLCIDNLFEGANFPRRSLSLQVLQHIMIVIFENFRHQLASLWNAKKFNVLFNVLYDTFEGNKKKTVELFKYLPPSQVESFSTISLEHLSKLCTSLKPAESLSAAYLMQFAIHFSIFEGDFQTHYSATLNMLLWTEELLVKGLSVAEKSIVVAAGSNPLYGCTLCIRHVISTLELNQLKDNEEWRKFFIRLLALCRRLTSVVAPIVNSSAPEGIYPDEEFNITDVDNVEKIIDETTPQIILLCAWRVIKEVSLLLGDIASRVCVNSDNTGLLTASHVLAIGELFLELLSKIKHRGAFEQCFIGFSQYCVSLRSSQVPELCNFPKKILENLIKSISGESDDSEMRDLCATRRSAGLPLIIQALIVSELKISRSENLNFVMKNLLSFAKCGGQVETRIHSLNILRALFRCKELNEKISEYLSSGLKCSLLGYSASSWSERNSSTLLFSALMVRIFGVQRSKHNDEINIRNKMSGKIFFLRFPDLYEFLMQQLIDAVESVKIGRKCTKLHPLLLLLNRLYTSPLDCCESNFKLAEFIPLVSQCSASSELQTRILCAKFIAQNISPNLITGRITNELQVLMKNYTFSANVKHGKLLKIFHLTKHENDLQKLMCFLNSNVVVLLKLFNNENICFITVLDVVIQVLKKTWNCKINEDIFDEIDNSLKFSEASAIGSPLLYRRKIMIDVLKMHFTCEYDSPLLKNLSSLNYHELKERLNYILMLIDLDYAKEVMDDYEMDISLCWMMENLEKRSNVTAKILNDKYLKCYIEELMESDDYYIRAKSYEILSYMNIESKTAEFVNQLVEEGCEKPDAMRKAMLKYVNAILKCDRSLIHSVNWKYLSKSILQSSFLVKITVIELLDTISGEFNLIKGKQMMINFIQCIVLLLVDDETEIQQKASAIVSKMSGVSTIYMPSYAQELLIGLFMEKSSFNKLEKIAMVLILWRKEGKSSAHEVENEYQVFEKNDSNVFRESHVVREIYKSCLLEHPVTCDEKDKIIDIHREMGATFDESEISECIATS